HRHDDALEVTDPQALLAYLRSLVHLPEAVTPELEAALARWEAEVLAHATPGPTRVERAAGVFLARCRAPPRGPGRRRRGARSSIEAWTSTAPRRTSTCSASSPSRRRWCAWPARWAAGRASAPTGTTPAPRRST